MIEIKSKKKLKNAKKNLEVLDFENFNYLDVIIDEKLSKKELHSFLEYKIAHKFSLEENLYEYFYLRGHEKNIYQVYSVKKSIFSENKKNILIPKSLAYRSFGEKYYLLLIEDDKSYIMLYINGHFMLSNYISFSNKDLQDDSKIKALLVFIKDIIEHINKDDKLKGDIKSLFIQINEEYVDTINDNIPSMKQALGFQEISIVDQVNFYKNIDVNLHKGRRFYRVYPFAFSLISIISLSVVSFIAGYVFLYLEHEKIEQDIQRLQSFYNRTNKDVKEYYTLGSNFLEMNNTLEQKKALLGSLTSHSRGFDITSTLVNVLSSVGDYDVYLQSIEIKSEGAKRLAYIDVIMKDKRKIKEYMKTAPSFSVQTVKKEKDLFTYRIKAQIK